MNVNWPKAIINVGVLVVILVASHFWPTETIAVALGLIVIATAERG